MKAAQNVNLIIMVQALARMHIARNRFRRLKDDAAQYVLLMPSARNDYRFEKVLRSQAMWGTRDYKAPLVEEMLEQLGEFNYEDKQSKAMLQEMEMHVRSRDEVIDAENAKYLGQWSGSLRHGMGRCIWPSGMRYDGYWANNEHNGKGRMLYPDGSYYIGYWKDNQKNGSGKLVRADQTVYDGEWKSDEQHGFGKEQWHDGNFEGQYNNGFRHGSGKFTMFDGSSYEGMFSNNKMEG